MSDITLNTLSVYAGSPYVNKTVVTRENGVFKTKNGEIAYIHSTSKVHVWPPRCMNDADAFWACTDSELIMMVSKQLENLEFDWASDSVIEPYLTYEMKAYMRGKISVDPFRMGGDGVTTKDTCFHDKLSIQFIPKDAFFTVEPGIGVRLISTSTLYMNNSPSDYKSS